MNGVIPVSISNKSLDFYKNQVFQSFLDIEGLTEIAVNRLVKSGRKLMVTGHSIIMTV